MAFIENVDEDEPQMNTGEGFLGTDAAEQNGQFDQPNQMPPTPNQENEIQGGTQVPRPPRHLLQIGNMLKIPQMRCTPLNTGAFFPSESTQMAQILRPSGIQMIGSCLGDAFWRNREIR